MGEVRIFARSGEEAIKQLQLISEEEAAEMDDCLKKNLPMVKKIAEFFKCSIPTDLLEYFAEQAFVKAMYELTPGTAVHFPPPVIHIIRHEIKKLIEENS